MAEGYKFIDHDANHKRCMTCYEIMPADEYCECLKRVGREIRRKAHEQCKEQTNKPEKRKHRNPRSSGGNHTLF